MISMRPHLLRLLPALLIAAGSAAHAQGQPQPDAAQRSEELKRLCETVSMDPADGAEFARRAECVLSGMLPSPNRVGEARGLARAALAKGAPAGASILYLAFLADPANQAMHDGKVDPQAYQRLASRTVQERKDQIEAIEALGTAAGHNNIAAGVLLAGYFHDTVAPMNVARTGAMAALLIRIGEHGPVVERFAREADAIAKDARATKTSPRTFMETYPQAVAAARAGYQAQSGGKTCDKPQLKSVSAGEIQGAEYLPLQGLLVKDTYLMKGQWTEYWTFAACGAEVPLKLAFAADGWGGATSTVSYNKGE
jgi:hypothetical protein